MKIGARGGGGHGRFDKQDTVDGWTEGERRINGEVERVLTGKGNGKIRFGGVEGMG